MSATFISAVPNVHVEEIRSLRSLNYSWKRISELLGISRSTLYCRLRNTGISTNNSYISATELDEVIKK